jgi:hypothetical protein
MKGDDLDSRRADTRKLVLRRLRRQHRSRRSQPPRIRGGYAFNALGFPGTPRLLERRLKSN